MEPAPSFRIVRFLLLLFTIGLAQSSGVGWAQPPCQPGEILNVSVSLSNPAGGHMVIDPQGTGTTFAGINAMIDVCITCNGVPLANLPADQVRITHPGLVFCTDGNIASGPTNASGCTSFTGALRGGGCTYGQDVFVEVGAFIAAIPITVNSPDLGSASPLFVDAADIAAFAGALGVPAAVAPPTAWCFDFAPAPPGSPPVDSSDLAYFAARLGMACP